jgi:hypothetical protein
VAAEAPAEAAPGGPAAPAGRAPARRPGVARPGRRGAPAPPGVAAWQRQVPAGGDYARRASAPRACSPAGNCPARRALVARARPASLASTSNRKHQPGPGAVGLLHLRLSMLPLAVEGDGKIAPADLPSPSLVPVPRHAIEHSVEGASRFQARNLKWRIPCSSRLRRLCRNAVFRPPSLARPPSVCCRFICTCLTCTATEIQWSRPHRLGALTGRHAVDSQGRNAT